MPADRQHLGDSPGTAAGVEVRLTKASTAIRGRQLIMRHTRCFSNASPEQVLSLLMRLKFYGPGGLMAASTADSEEDAPDGRSRFIKNFRPGGNWFGSRLAGSFNVRQELMESAERRQATLPMIRMTFSPARPEDEVPNGSFLWRVEPGPPNENGTRACWTELINTEETRAEGLPDLRVGTWRRWVFSFGHNRLMQKAAQKIADVLNGDSNMDVFAKCIWKCKGRGEGLQDKEAL